MTLVLDLPPAVQRQLETEAAKEGMTAEAYALKKLDEALPSKVELPARQDPSKLSLLLQEWIDEDANMTPEEAAQAEKEWEEFASAMNASHTSNRVLYP
jgi:hypothetical protein